MVFICDISTMVFGNVVLLRITIMVVLGQIPIVLGGELTIQTLIVIIVLIVTVVPVSLVVALQTQSIKMALLLVHLPVHFLHVQQAIQRQIKIVVQPVVHLLGKEFLNLGIQSIPVEKETLMDVVVGVITSIAIEMRQIQVHLQPQPML